MVVLVFIFENTPTKPDTEFKIIIFDEKGPRIMVEKKGSDGDKEDITFIIFSIYP